jgi:nucleoside-diphosphate-sugar epimerase
VSSVVAMMPSRRQPLTADSPVGKPRELYMASKAAAEEVARRHQEEGAPVAISYPPALAGPHDPHLGDLATRVRNVLRGLVPMWPTGGLPLGDVRDTAELHAAMLDSPDAALQGRYFGPSHYLTTRELIGVLREVTGRALPTIYLPALSMLPVGAMAGFAQRFLPFQLPAEYGGIYICRCATRVDEGVNTPLGIRPRPTTETLADTVRWLYGQGLLSDRQAGSAASGPVAATGKEGTRVRATP